MQFTVEQIKSLITNNDIAVGRAMVALYNEQTIDEKNDGQTRNTNGRGFSYRTAPKGTYYAKWVLSGKKLTGYHLDNARKIAMFHIKQLCNLANSNMKKKNEVVVEAEVISDDMNNNNSYSLAIVGDNEEMIVG